MNHEELHSLIDAAVKMAECSSAKTEIQAAITGSLLDLALAGTRPGDLQGALLEGLNKH